MDLKKELLRRIARAKANGRDNLVEMLEHRLEQLENPRSAQELYMSAPISNRKE